MDFSSAAADWRVKYPNASFAVSMLLTSLFVVLGSGLAQDPLTLASVRGVAWGITALFAFTLCYGIWNKFRVAGTRYIPIVLILIVGMEYGMHYLFVHDAISGTGPQEAQALDLMKDNQVIAVRCMQKGLDLKGQSRGWNRGIPDSATYVCYYEKDWKYLPAGWAYDRIKDAQVSNGTFTFSARSRGGDAIICTQIECRIVTATETKGGASISVVTEVPEGGTISTGEKKIVAVIKVTNTGKEPVNLHSLWFQKTGTATNDVLDMITLEEGDSSFSTSFKYELRLAQDGQVYIDQLDMFLMQPGVTRTYTMKIDLTNAANLEEGKTVGIDLTGFGYNTAIKGMPHKGAIYTISK